MQIASGAVGALIIEGDFADVPEIAAAKERFLVLTEAVFDQFGMIEDFVQRWRICHMMNHEGLGMMEVVEVYADN